MEATKKKNLLPFYFIAVVAIILVGLNVFSGQKQSIQTKPTLTVTPGTTQTEVISYQGREGVDALTILKEKAQIEQDNSGLVIMIDNRRSDTAKREYWAFYVNGAMSQVGPADYKTKDGDKIEWKIEAY